MSPNELLKNSEKLGISGDKFEIEGIKNEVAEVSMLFDALANEANADKITAIQKELNSIKEPFRRDIHTAVKKVLRLVKDSNSNEKQQLIIWLRCVQKCIRQFHRLKLDITAQ